MRVGSRLFAGLVLIGSISGCAADPTGSSLPPAPTQASLDSAPGSAEQSGDTPPGTTAGAASSTTGAAPSPPVVAETIPTSPDFGAWVIARALDWVGAGVPYCGAPNGQPDPICGGTCSRTGSASRPEWDPYRSDCSGFVSWVWGLPAPGRRTATLAPFVIDVTGVVTVADLALGDALNGDGHVSIWGGWIDQSIGKAKVYEATHCAAPAGNDNAYFTMVDATSLLRASDGRTYHPIRLRR
jgi:hypothetical protein